MFRIKVKERPLRTGITIQRKIFGMWIYWDGYNVSSASIAGRRSQVLEFLEDIKQTYNVTDDNVFGIASQNSN